MRRGDGREKREETEETDKRYIEERKQERGDRREEIEVGWREVRIEE